MCRRVRIFAPRDCRSRAFRRRLVAPSTHPIVPAVPTELPCEVLSVRVAGGDRSSCHVDRAGRRLSRHCRAHGCLSFVRLSSEVCRAQRVGSVACAPRLPGEWEASAGSGRAQVRCLIRICGVDLRYGSTADQGWTGREDSTSRPWRPARVVGTHAQARPTNWAQRGGLASGRGMSDAEATFHPAQPCSLVTRRSCSRAASP